MVKIENIDGDFYLPEIDLWLDPQKKQSFAFISHAHMDHVKNHSRALCSKPTRHFLKLRSKVKSYQTYDYHEEFLIGTYKLTLLPAGHILGSSMLFIENNGDTLLFTGDVKFNSSYSSEDISLLKANTLITEASFGHDSFVFPQKEELLENIKRTIKENKTPVFFTYTLGKSQEILLMLKNIDHDKQIYLHESILRLNKTYEKFGYTFPTYKKMPSTFHSNAIYILPVHLRHFHLFKEQQITAIYTTGWALDEEKLKQMKCDIALPISDHAGFDELNNIVKHVEPKRIICHHGRPAYADYLKTLGYDVTHIEENIYNEG